MLRCFTAGIPSSCSKVSSCRSFSTSASRFSTPETVTIPCSREANITLNVYRPLKASNGISNSAVAIYLPRGPILESPEQDASNAAVLHSASKSHVVQINYRCGTSAQYPTPIHDVLVGYDWIVSNLLPKRAITRVGRSEHTGKLAVCGELVGGQLATMLALTECRIGEPGIVAAAVNNPIVDWVGLEDNDRAIKTRIKNAKSSELTLGNLLSQRSTLFRKPEHYHDPFASPVLFFRTSGAEVAEPDKPETGIVDDMDELALLEREEYARSQQPANNAPDIMNMEPLTTDGEVSVRRRKSSRRYPSKALNLRLPRFLIGNGTDSSINGQANELAHLLGQSFTRQSNVKLPGKSRLEHEDEETDAKSTGMVSRREYSGLGLWDDSTPGQERMRDAAKWISQAIMT